VRAKTAENALKSGNLTKIKHFALIKNLKCGQVITIYTELSEFTIFPVFIRYVEIEINGMTAYRQSEYFEVFRIISKNFEAMRRLEIFHII
jgi:hypothetical protein